MDRFWLLTSTTYGTWLPGDRRGFVGRVRDAMGATVIHNLPGTPCDEDFPGRVQAARDVMKGPPIYLRLEHAAVLLAQFQETARYRSWQLLAVAIMANHVHWVVGIPGDPDPDRVRGDFKSYGSRVLNRQCGKPPSVTWWTDRGSSRMLKDPQAVVDGVIYVRDQPNPLLVWLSPEAQALASGGR